MTFIALNGIGPFAEPDEGVFDHNWMYYITKDMAKAVNLKNALYKNLIEYKDYKQLNG